MRHAVPPPPTLLCLRLLVFFLFPPLHPAPLLLTLLGVSLVVFVLIRVVPGDPGAMMTPPGAGPGDIARLRAFYGLERSIPEQYGLWLVRAVQGEFGTSISLR